MFNQILILILLSGPLLTKETKPYFCDSREKIDEIANLESNLKRIIRNEDKFYFVLKNRIIFTKIPKLLPIQNGTVDFETYEFYEQENLEIDLPDGIPANHKIYGHVYDSETSLTSELYYLEKTDKNSKLETQLFDQVYELDFKGDELAKRVKLNKIPDYLKLGLFEDEAESEYIDSIYSKDYKFLVRFDRSTKKPNSTKDSLFVEFESEKKLKLLSIMDGYPKTKFFLTDLESLEKSIKVLFFGIDKVTSQINLVFSEIAENLNPTEIKIAYKFNDLLSCHVPYDDYSQLKGIYFSNDTFYIFISRFYLRIETDLVQTGFNLTNDLYNENSLNLRFENNDIYKTIKYENLNRRWVKTFGAESYFVTSDVDHFKLIATKTELVIEKTNINDETIKKCIKQTFYIVETKDNYCFEETEFTHQMSNKKFLIKDIFKLNGSIEWTENQKLKFIFNYKEDKVVFLTATDLFVFTYQNFKVNSNKELTYLNDKNETIFTTLNCLFGRCKPEPSSIDQTTPKNQFEPNNLNKMTSIVIILNLIVLFFYL